MAPGMTWWVVAARAVAPCGLWTWKAGTGRAVARARATALFFAFFASTVVILRVVPVSIVGQIACTSVAVASTGQR